MNRLGFQLRRLTLAGNNIPDAEVCFTNGLNVITGPSDTGKTFILQCIDYMLGGKNKPKDIPEAQGYDTATLEIKRNSDSKVFKLQRSILRTGNITLTSDGDDDRILKQQHKANTENTLSHFLLEGLNLTEKEIRKNVRNETQSLSFRNLSHLCIVSEENVIRDISPVLTGQYTTATAEKSVFNLLLSGVDDTELTASDDPKVSKARINAKIEMLKELIGQTTEQIEQKEIDSALPALKEQLIRLEFTHKEACNNLVSVEASITEVEHNRQNLWKRLRGIESRLNVLNGLGERFELLGMQYVSDLNRLEAITETSQCVEQMVVERCPVCGSPADCHDKEHQNVQTDPIIVVQSCLAEKNRIQTLIKDLHATRKDLADETQTLSVEKKYKQSELDKAVNNISDYFRPKAQEALQHMHETRILKDGLCGAIELFERIAEFERLIFELENSKEKTPEASSENNTPTRDIDIFCIEVESRLQNWNCPDMNRVTFNHDSKIWDIIISGRERSSHGKGIRAVTHAAFTLALLSYCVNKKLPHPGFVVIDSPLVVYREPDSDENNFSKDVKYSFFKDIASAFAEEQVIIIENEEPPQDIEEGTFINTIKFTKSATGRFGFIPILGNNSNE